MSGGVEAEPDPADIRTPLSTEDLYVLCQMYGVQPRHVLALEPWQQLAIRDGVRLTARIREPRPPSLSLRRRWQLWRQARQIARLFDVPWKYVR